MGVQHTDLAHPRLDQSTDPGTGPSLGPTKVTEIFRVKMLNFDYNSSSAEARGRSRSPVRLSAVESSSVTSTATQAQPSELVLVTGGTGFVASHLIQQLVLRGYRVRATIRQKSSCLQQDLIDAMYKPFAHMPNIKDVLEIVQCDLLYDKIENNENIGDSDPCRWDGYSDWKAAFAGVSFVFHVASPYFYPDVCQESAVQSLLQSAIEGTRRILHYCQKTSTVRKLVLTSCIQAMCGDWDSRVVYSETHWNDDCSIRESIYAFSKTAAEKMAHEFCEQSSCHFKLVTLLPGIVWGPVISGRHLSFSHRFLLAFLNGNASAVVNFHYNISDVRDVAFAHILAMEKEQLQGRYCLCNEPLALEEVLHIVRRNFPQVKVPYRKARDFLVRVTMAIGAKRAPVRNQLVTEYLGKKANINCRKALEAGMILRPPTQTIIDTVECFIAGDMLASSEMSKELFST